MRTRVAATAVYGMLLGAWVYLDQREGDLDYSQGAYDVLYSIWFELAFLMALPILLGAYVRRWWVLAALAGPFAVLACLQLTGYDPPGHDGAPPLGFVNLVATAFQALPLLVGLGVGQVIEALSAARSRRA